jgi:C1A family cysteine protease
MADRIGGYRIGKMPDDVTQKKIKKNLNLPPKVDLRKFMTSVEMQVGNSCVANSFAGAYEYLAKRTLGDSSDVSRLFIYYNARYFAGEQEEDNGSMMVNAIEGLKEYGACSEDYWPNDNDRITEEPDEDSYNHGANFRIVEAEFIKTDLDLWRQTLAEGYPIAFALNTFKSFDSANRNKGRVIMPRASDEVRETHGWHAMLCVGYSDPDQMFIVRNSWGEKWGDGGYCYIPYDYVMHEDYNGHDSWIVKAVENLDYSEDISDDSEESNFYDEDRTYLTDFYIQVEDPEDFAVQLEALCQEYVTEEDEFYFDYETIEDEDGVEYLEITNFEILTDVYEDFLADLDALCDEYAIDGDYEYALVGAEEEEEDE